MADHDYTTFTEPLSHPGVHLRELWMPDYQLTAGKLAKAMGLKDRNRIEQIVRCQRAVTADTALRLSRVFETSPEFWLNLQAQHDLSREAIANRVQLAEVKAIVAA